MLWFKWIDRMNRKSIIFSSTEFQGDSGGPISTYNPNVSCMYVIVGVTSFGKVCGSEGVPGIYTRVYPYLDWIENIVWPNA